MNKLEQEDNMQLTFLCECGHWLDLHADETGCDKCSCERFEPLTAEATYNDGNRVSQSVGSVS